MNVNWEFIVKNIHLYEKAALLTLRLAWVKKNPEFTVGVPSFGGQDTIAPAVLKGNKELLVWINTELETLGKENFVHKAYDETLKSTYGDEYKENLIIEGGKVK